MYDVITFGSATLDFSIMMPDNLIVKQRKSVSGKAYQIDLGSKADIKDIYFGFGGGGVNTAITFKKQGFRVAYCGKVGEDTPGNEVIEFLEAYGIDTSLIKKTKTKYTNNSVILDNPKEDRTVLAYRGAAEFLSEEDLPKDLQSKWFYLAPLSGKLSKLTFNILSLAKENNIKTAVNFGNSQIKMPKARIKEILSKTDVLILNKEEAALLTGVNYKNEKKIIEAIVKMHAGINVITKGEDGVVVIAENKIYEAKLNKFKVVDETGAGDAFGSGFISGLIQQSDIEYCICLGLTNSKYAISTRGATTGLLSKKDNYLVEKEKIKIKVSNAQNT
jgi:ribokinase